MAENPGCKLDLTWINNVAVNAWGVNESVKEISSISDKVQGPYRAAWLLKAVSCIDLTTLAGDDTWSNVTRLSYQATRPISAGVLEKLNFSVDPFTTAAVCVYPSRVADAVKVIKKMSLTDELPVAAVATGFPSGQYKLRTRLMEIQDCIDDGAKEIDVVVDRSLILGGHWDKLYDELRQMREACSQGVKMKTILSVGELGDFRNVYKASLVAMMAGSDFIKTSTGKEAVNATLPVGLVMMRAIRDYYLETSNMVGFKAAGGIKTSKDALNWLVLCKRELGRTWLTKQLFRIGASGLLNDIEKELYSLAYN